MPGHVGALEIVVDRQLVALDPLCLGARRERRHGAVERQSEQLVAVVGGVHRLEAELLRERLVGQPRLLLFRAQHAHARLALFARVGKAVLHERAPIALPLGSAIRPEAVHVQVVVAHDGNPCRLERGVLDEHRVLHLQLAEHVALAQAVGEPRTFRLDAWMGLFDADNAGEMLVGQVLRREVDEFGLHGHLRPLRSRKRRAPKDAPPGMSQMGAAPIWDV